MKLDETTEFLIDWGDHQQLTVFEGVAVAASVIAAGPLPLQVGVRSTSYMALGRDVPEAWLALFASALDPTSMQADVTYVSRAEGGFLTQGLSFAPCEQGEHLHASVSLTYTLVVDESATAEAVKAALYEAWRRVGDQMAEVQDQWFHPYLEQALELETLHGGVS
jgi:hypothetical protein